MEQDLTSAIYSAPLESRPWMNVLPSLRERTASDRIMLKFSRAHSPGGVAFTDAARTLASADTIYTTFYQYQDPVDYGVLKGGDLLQFDDLIPRSDLVSSEYYQRFCSPLDIEHAFFCSLGEHDGINVLLSGSRGGATGRFSHRELSRVAEILPDLTRSVRFACRIERQRFETAVYADAVAGLGFAVVLLDEKGLIVGTSSAADALLSRSSAVKRLDDRLLFCAHAGGAFRDLMRLTRLNPALPLQGMVARGDRDCVSFVVRKVEDSLPKGGSWPALAVYLSVEEKGLSEGMVDFIANSLAMTRVEARFAILLAEGHSISSIASILGVTPTTAQTYRKRAMAKAGVSRQLELVHLVAGRLSQLARLAT